MTSEFGCVCSLMMMSAIGVPIAIVLVANLARMSTSGK